jgi:hypothetical protein
MEQGYRQLVNPKFVEKARLLEQLTPLRLGIVAPTPPWSSSRSKRSRSED